MRTAGRSVDYLFVTLTLRNIHRDLMFFCIREELRSARARVRVDGAQARVFLNDRALSRAESVRVPL